MPYYITKHALTKGIFEIEGRINDHDKRILMRTVNGKGINDYYTGRQWHKTKEGAVKEAERVRDEKVKSLKGRMERLGKEIEELNKMTFA
jgi:hypothetical protein